MGVSCSETATQNVTQQQKKIIIEGRSQIFVMTLSVSRADLKKAVCCRVITLSSGRMERLAKQSVRFRRDTSGEEIEGLEDIQEVRDSYKDKMWARKVIRKFLYHTDKGK